MNVSTLLIAGVLLLPGLQPPTANALEISNQPAGDPDDTARGYIDVWSRFPGGMRWVAPVDFDSANPKLLADPKGETPNSWPEVAKKLEESQPQISELMRLARNRRCSFGAAADSDKASFFGSSSVILRADAARLWASGDVDGCTDRLCAMYGLIDHAARQDEATHRAMAWFMLRWTNASARVYITQRNPELTGPQAARLFEAFDRIDAAAMDRLAARLLEAANEPDALPDWKTRAPQLIDAMRTDQAETRSLIEKAAQR